jgi:hypothetical protein
MDLNFRIKLTSWYSSCLSMRKNMRRNMRTDVTDCRRARGAYKDGHEAGIGTHNWTGGARGLARSSKTCRPARESVARRGVTNSQRVRRDEHS